jgi:hypothetical protein
MLFISRFRSTISRLDFLFFMHAFSRRLDRLASRERFLIRAEGRFGPIQLV